MRLLIIILLFFYIAIPQGFAHSQMAHTPYRAHRVNRVYILGSQVNVNTADVQTLMQLQGINARRAHAIVKYREKHAGIRDLDEFRKIKGIGSDIAQRNKSRIKF